MDRNYIIFIGTLSFFYWEANHPLPKEFMILGAVIFILSLMQYLYLGWFLNKVQRKDMYLLHIFLYMGVSVILLSLLIARQNQLYAENWIFMILVLILCFIYATIFYIFNRWIACKFLLY